MKAVLDTNVWVSGIFWKGPSHDIIRLGEANAIELYATQEMVDELFGVIQREKFRMFFQEAATSFNAVADHVLKIVKVHPPIEAVDVIKEDPTDNKFLACARAVQASCIVSGDPHLLTLKEYRGIPILTPRAFLDTYPDTVRMQDAPIPPSPGMRR